MLDGVELFSGCGGLAYGLSQAGVSPRRMVEFNKSAVATIEHNRRRGIEHVRDWPIERLDVRQAEWGDLAGSIDVLAGGPPCQPFSIGGRHAGEADPRDMWPEAIRALRELRPAAFLFENVRGLRRPVFADYLAWIMKQLERPASDAAYWVTMVPVNAADYGASQQRHRLIFVGLCRERFTYMDANIPAATHSRARLLWDQWITGDYWTEHGISMPDRSVLTPSDLNLVNALERAKRRPETLRWRTVRDAFKGLGEPDGLANHVFQPGARSYKGHTGSCLDMPAKALKAGTHGVPGGENMLRSEDGSVRYFTIRETARLQGLPDDYEFPGSWTESMRQLGNAVPTELANFFGAWVADMCRARAGVAGKA